MDIYWGYNGMYSQQSDNIVLFDYIVYINIYIYIFIHIIFYVQDPCWLMIRSQVAPANIH